LLEGLLSEIQRKGYQALVTEVRDDDELEMTIRRFHAIFECLGSIVYIGAAAANLVNACVQHNIPGALVIVSMDMFPSGFCFVRITRWRRLLVSEQLNSLWLFSNVWVG